MNLSRLKGRSRIEVLRFPGLCVWQDLVRSLLISRALPRGVTVHPPLGRRAACFCLDIFVRLTVLCLLVACQKAPPEPTSAPTSAPVAIASKRCMEPLEASPKAVPARIPPSACPKPDASFAPLAVSVVAVGGARVSAEVARTSAETERGLMYRTSLPNDSGMWFDLRERAVHKFWMRDTCIPLDILFIDDDGLLVGVAESAVPLTEDSRGVNCASRYVLEVNAGWVRAHHVKPGDHVEWRK